MGLHISMHHGSPIPILDNLPNLGLHLFSQKSQPKTGQTNQRPNMVQHHYRLPKYNSNHKEPHVVQQKKKRSAPRGLDGRDVHMVDPLCQFGLHAQVQENTSATQLRRGADQHHHQKD